MSGPSVEPDRAQLATFVETLFPHAADGGRISIRTFPDDQSGGAPRIHDVLINGSGLSTIVDVAFHAAQAARPLVVAPPVCVFRPGDTAGEADVAEGVAARVELDQSPTQGLAKLKLLIGLPTIVMASGGQCQNPETGELEDKVHAHFRLSEPATSEADLVKLRRVNELLCEIAGGDRSAIPLSHPMRWPGSVHRKNPDAPRLARIVEHNPESEFHLDELLIELEGLAPTHRKSTQGKPNGAAASGQPYEAQAADAVIEVIGMHMPNPLAPEYEGGPPRDDWETWNTIGMAFHRASGGGEAGLRGFLAYSGKHPTKFDEAYTRQRWAHYHAYPANRVGIGSLYYEVRRVEPDFMVAGASYDRGQEDPESEIEPEAEPAADPQVENEAPEPGEIEPSTGLPTSLKAPTAEQVAALPDAAPGALRRFTDWVLASASHPQPMLALGAAICWYGTLMGQHYRLVDGPDTRSAIYVLAVAESGAGKDHPRKCAKEVVMAMDLGDCLGEEIRSDAGIHNSVYR
jgi:hypothetical protein